MEINPTDEENEMLDPNEEELVELTIGDEDIDEDTWTSLG